MRLIPAVLLLIAIQTTADPKSNYMIHCMGCHLPDGRGMPPEVPEFNEELGTIVRTERGRAYLVRVPGAAQSPLSDHELASVLNWMLTRYSSDSLPESFEPYSSVEVSKYRSQVLADPLAERKGLLER